MKTALGAAGANCSLRELGAKCDNIAIGAGCHQPGPHLPVPEQGKQSSLWAAARLSFQSSSSDKSVGIRQIPVQAGKSSPQVRVQMSGLHGQVQAWLPRSSGRSQE